MSATSGAQFIERTLLFCDIERSTERWDTDGESMRVLLEHHDAVIAAAIGRHHGEIVKRTGDGAVAAFQRSLDALSASIEVQHRLQLGPSECGLHVAALASRVGLHRGVVEPRDGDLHGPPMHRAARIMSAGHGGQILLSRAVADDLEHTELIKHGVVLDDRGTHRLKGFHEPEQISQATVEGLRSEFPPLVTQNATSGWMPAAPSHLVGRDDDVSKVLALLSPSRIVSLVGVGGVGKTSLAVHVAEAARPAFPDGVWFVDLAAVTERERVLQAVADAVRLPVEGAATAADVVDLACRTRRMLLVLDNCEHLLADVVSALQRVVSASSAATVLCTSQRDLGLAHETVVHIEPLPTSGEVDAGQPTLPPSVEMFVQRATLAHPQFSPSADDVAAITRICSLLDGLPLAIELAAARVRTMPLAAIAERLEASFDLLSSRDHTQRHRTLGAAISWSTHLLDPVDLRTLHSLAAFSGTFDWNAAAAVVGGDEAEVIDALDELVRRSLVARAGEKFRLLAPMRSYCLRELSGEEFEVVRERHARFMVSTVPSPLDTNDVHELTSRIDAIQEASEDLRAAYAWLLGSDPEAGAELALGLVDFWVTRGRSREAFEWLSRADIDAVPTTLRLHVLGWVSAFSWVIGRNADCERACRSALELAAAAGLAPPPLATSRLSVLLVFTGNTSAALEAAATSESSLRGDEHLMAQLPYAARVLGALAVVYSAAGDIATAVRLADEAVKLANSAGVAARMSALTNRMVITPTDPSTLPLITEIEELAAITGRQSARGHTALAAARLRLSEGDIAGFLRGLADNLDSMLATGEASFLRQGLESTPAALQRPMPREAAIFLGVVGRMADELGSSGTDARLAELKSVRDHLARTLGAEAFDAAIGIGRGMSVDEAVDHVRWLADQQTGEPNDQ